MKKPTCHILVCNSYRVAGDAQGACNKKGAAQFIPYIMEGCADRGIDAAISSTGCLNVCAQGPVLVVHPHNTWYGGIDSEEKIDEILDAMEENSVVDKYIISD